MLEGHQKVFGTTLNDIQDLISLAQIDFLEESKTKLRVSGTAWVYGHEGYCMGYYKGARFS